MREIKFRAWDKKEKKYHSDIGIDSGDSSPRCIDVGEPLKMITFNDITIEQYTGLKDKNGVDIYENDIVEHVLGLAKIVYQYGEFRIIGITEDIYDRMYHELIDATIPKMEGSRFDGITTRLKIVGTIHE